MTKLLAHSRLLLFRSLDLASAALVGLRQAGRLLTDEYAKGQWRRKASEKMEYGDYRDAWNDGGDFERERCVQLCERMAEKYDQMSREATVCLGLARAIGSNRKLKDIVEQMEAGS